MPIWGKVLGTLFGFMFGRIPGALLGFVVGHLFDRGYSQDFNQLGGFSRFFTNVDELRSQAIFFHTLFSIMGHIAKADGRVTPEEIQIATALMDQMGLEGDVRREAQQAFNEGKAADFPLKSVLKEFKESCHGRRDILQIYLEILIQAAYADGRLDKAEQKVLEEVAKQLGFKRDQLLYLISSFEAEARFRGAQRQQQQQQQRSRQGQRQQSSSYSQTQTLQDAYKILGVSEQADNAAIKKAYRKLMATHHPDKLVSKGLPEQAMELAKRKTQDIQAAYELLKKSKGF